MSDNSPEILAARRAMLEEIRERMSSSYDRTLLTLSAGAFSVSVLFYEKIAHAPVETGWLMGAWIAFASCVLVVLHAFFSSEKAIRGELDAMDKGEAVDTQPEQRIETLNAVAGLSFGAGVVMLLIFASCNLVGQQTEGETPMTNKVGREEKNAYVPRPIKQGSSGGSTEPGSGSGSGTSTGTESGSGCEGTGGEGQATDQQSGGGNG